MRCELRADLEYAYSAVRSGPEEFKRHQDSLRSKVAPNTACTDVESKDISPVLPNGVVASITLDDATSFEAWSTEASQSELQEALALAARFGAMRVLEDLIEIGADANEASPLGALPLQVAASSKVATRATLQRLVEEGATPGKRGFADLTPVASALYARNMHAIDFFLQLASDSADSCAVLLDWAALEGIWVNEALSALCSSDQCASHRACPADTERDRVVSRSPKPTQ